MIEISGLSFSFGHTRVLDGLDLKLAPGARLFLSGDSGSGKTTLLRLIAGLDFPSAGRILLGGREVSRPDWCLDAHQRGISMVFQNPALFPHLSVAENIAFALPGGSEETRRKRTKELLEAVELETLAERKPSGLSGGQARRVALARALAPRAPILLLDEPLVHLPADIRGRMRRLIDDEIAETGATLIEVSHEPGAAGESARRMRLSGGRLREEE